MRILIVQESLLDESPIICDFSAFLKSYGNEVFLLIQRSEKNLLGEIKKISPDIIFIQAEILGWNWARRITREIKREFKEVKIGAFGSLPTFYMTDSNLDVDFLILGEPELPALNLISYLSGEKADLRNIFLRSEDGKYISYGFSPLEIDLNSLPLPDRKIYERYKLLTDFPVKRFIISRGCMLSCSFCYISALKNVFGLRLRKKFPERAVQDVISVKEKYPLSFVHFSDDIFPVYDRRWLSDFCNMWKKEVKLPFSIFAIASFINDDVARILKDAGCRLVIFGLETYNEERRAGFLEKKGVSNSVIENAFGSLKKAGIYVGTTNIIGLPSEEIDDWFKTAEYNFALKTDLPLATKFTYIPHTKISSNSCFDWEAEEFRDIFPLCAGSKLFLNISKFVMRNNIDFLLPVLKLFSLSYLSLKMKRIYSIRFLDGVKYLISAGLINQRTNVLNGLS
ncbi:hypothetical protein HRbin19_00468 [bacterium HR19]|nr:hypothetical protein HRbin19_00468 [bacterium HR19]